MTTVLAALDANASAKPVLNAASALAPLFDATVTGLHVREQERGAAQELARDAGVELRQVGGSPVDGIVAAAQAADVVALVLGARGVHGGPQPAGHTALEIITRVRKPVVVVPPDARSPERLSRVLVALEGSGETSQALEAMMVLARRRGVELLVLHVHSPASVPAFTDHEPYAARTWEREFLARNVAAPYDVRLVRRLGVPADDVVTVAGEEGAEVIVLAWSQDLSRGRATVVSRTLSHSKVPVLLLPIDAPSGSGPSEASRLSRTPQAGSAPHPDATRGSGGLDAY